MSKLSPLGPLSPKDLKIYKHDFARGSKVLKEASQAYYQTTEPHKKKQLQKSMKEAIKAMNEIINNVLHEKGTKYEKKISKDYTNFINNANSDNMKHLLDDVNDIQKSL